jgi:hypothetical protein
MFALPFGVTRVVFKRALAIATATSSTMIGDKLLIHHHCAVIRNRTTSCHCQIAYQWDSLL